MLIEAQGYVSKPETKSYGNDRSFSKFTLSVVQKDKKDGKWVKREKGNAFFNVADFTNSSAPQEGSFVKVKGYLDVRGYTDKQGVSRQSLDIKVTEIEISPPRGDAAEPPAAASSSPDMDFEE